MMQVLDTPIDTKEVELAEVTVIPPRATERQTKKERRKELIIDVNITFCTHVGWDGILVLLFSLMIAAIVMLPSVVGWTPRRLGQPHSP